MTRSNWEDALWREACVTTDIAALAVQVVTLAGPRHPLASLMILALDPREAGDEDGIEVVAAVPEAIAGGGIGTHARLAPEQARSFRLWLQQTPAATLDLRRPDPGLQAALAALFPDGPVDAACGGPGRSCLAIPLTGQGAVLGLALVTVGPQAAADPNLHRELLRCREPLAAALQNHRRVKELVALRQSAEADKQSLLNRLGRDKVLEQIVGIQGGLRSVMERVQMVAGSDVPVLVLGETGSGKEVIARALHARSGRAAGPFTRVNCGAIPPELIDSELFGHEKGSFTGAVSRRLGWFERSDGGTLLLDEIGELPRAAQVRLLRVLQDGTIQRVGGSVTLRVDVRIIAATHRDLAAMVQSGEFREDLWYRLAVFPLLLPPLRDRRQDIPALVDMLAKRAARRFGFRPLAAEPADMALLLDYPWPGNVRELGSVIDRAVILGEGRRLEIAKAMGIADGGGGARASSARGMRTLSAGQGGAGGPLASAGRAGPAARDILPLDEIVVRHLELALAASQGRVAGPGGAAALLGLNPNTLRSKLRKHGIDSGAFRKRQA